MDNALESRDVERFIETLLRDYGGVMDLSQLPPNAPLVHRLYERATNMCDRVVREDFRDKTQIYFRFVNNTEINAFAGSGVIDVVAASMAVPFALLETFARIMSTASAFPFIGDPSMEGPSRTAYLLPRRMEFELGRWDYPSCSVRASYVHFLARIAFDFLVVQHDEGTQDWI